VVAMATLIQKLSHFVRFNGLVCLAVANCTAGAQLYAYVDAREFRELVRG